MTDNIEFEAQVHFSRRKTVDEMVAAMVADGLEPSASREAINRLYQERVVEAKQEGSASMQVGFVLLALGLLCTIGTIVVASRNGGMFVITGGLISGGLGLIGNGYIQRQHG